MPGAVERGATGEEIFRALGRRIIAQYYTLGRNDFVSIVDLPSAEALAKALVEVGWLGVVSTQTMTGLLPELVYQTVKATG